MKVQDVIARRLTEARQAKGWSRTELAERVAPFMRGDWSGRSVWTAENGQRAFLAEDVVILAVVLGQRPEWFLTPDPADELATKGGEVIRGRDVIRLTEKGADAGHASVIAGDARAALEEADALASRLRRIRDRADAIAKGVNPRARARKTRKDSR